jgi:hypothetical protein
MASPFTTGCPVPEVIWNSLEETLKANMIRLAKDIAVTLGKPDAPLIQALKTATIRPYIFEGCDKEDVEVDMRCEVMCQPPATPLFYQACGRPVLWSAGTQRCAEHSYSAKQSYTLPKLQRLEHEEPLFVGEDGTVYTVDYEPVGTYSRETGRLRRFCVD